MIYDKISFQIFLINDGGWPNYFDILNIHTKLISNTLSIYEYQKDKNNKDKSKAIHVMGLEEV